MLIGEAMTVFWRSLRDIWEEMMPLAMVNLIWFISWAGPLILSVSVQAPWLAYSLVVAGAVLAAFSTAGLYHVTNRVAHGKTASVAQFREGVGLLWWRALVWLGVNLIVVALVVSSIVIYPRVFDGLWVVAAQGGLLALLLFWAVMQVYFWPMLIQLEETRMLLAWRYSAMLIVINPFYTFFLVTFTLVSALVTAATGILLALAGGALIALLGNNALLILLYRLGKIQDPRPPIGA